MKTRLADQELRSNRNYSDSAAGCALEISRSGIALQPELRVAHGYFKALRLADQELRSNRNLSAGRPSILPEISRSGIALQPELGGENVRNFN